MERATLTSRKIAKCVQLIKRPNTGTAFWRIKAHNGQTLAHAEIYSRVRSARAVARRLARQLDVPVIERNQ